MSGQTPAERAPTIYDVAEAAGVAPSTVSRTFARPGRVNADTAERIRQVAADLGYRTDPLARALPTRRTALIALVTSDLTNPFYFEIMRGAQAAVAEAGYTMIVADAQESGMLEREALERAVSTVEGIVLASSRMSESGIRTMAKQLPMVVLNRVVSGVPSVVTDVPRGMRSAADHLQQLHHRSVTYIAGPEASWTDGMRWRALREVAPELGMQVRRIGPYPPTVHGGVRAAKDVYREPTSAVIAYNDLLAIGVIRGLTAQHIVVPEQVSVIGHDNVFGADLVTPALTTVAAPMRRVGNTAVRSLLASVRSTHQQSDGPVVVPTQLVRRDSTAPPA